MEKTTIQITEGLRKKLKLLASSRDISYKELLEDFIEIFQSMIPFKNEFEFARWFEKNLDYFGFKKIIEKRKEFPDYKLEDIEGKIKNVEIEILGKDFIRHGHDPRKVDLIICVYSDKEYINGVPVLSIVKGPGKLELIRKKKQIIAVTLDKELVEKIDKNVDGVKIKSRSEFVEKVIKEYLKKICVILAGGDPEKLFIKELKTYRPLVKIGKKTLIEDNILKCKKEGFKNIIIVGSQKLISKLYEILGNGTEYGVSIIYVEEKKELGSAKSLELVKDYIKTDFLFLPCDFYFDFDIKKLLEFHRSHNGVVTVGIHAGTSYDWRKGIVQMDGYKIIDYEEKPKKPKTYLVAVFIGFMKPEIFDYIPPGDVFWSLQENVFPRLAKEGKLVGYPIAGNWVNIHTKEDLKKALELKK
jgi:dTDP-glucose pyrophosphorylase